MIRSIWTLLVGLAPPSRLKNRLLRLAGHEVANTAHILPSVIWKVDRVALDEQTYIGPFNVFRRLRLLELGEAAVIGQLNWIAALPSLFTDAVPTSGAVRLAKGASITSRHYIDAAAGLTLGEFSAIGGVRSTLLTHQLDINDSLLHTAPITIGHHVLMGSNVVMVPGASVPNRCQVVMGAVVGRGLEEEGCIYGGVPAKKLREVPDAALWERDYQFASPWWDPGTHAGPTWSRDAG